MGTKPTWGVLDAKALGSVDGWQKNAVPVLNKALLEQRQILHGGWTIADNALAKIITLDFVHGQETPIDIPKKFGTRALAFQPLEAYNLATGVALAVPSAPRYNRQRADGRLGVTIDFDLRHTEPCLIKTASAAQSINHATSTDMSGWNTTVKTRGSVITDNGTTFTLAEAGSYLVLLQAQLQQGVSYSEFQIWVDVDGVSFAGGSVDDAVAFSNGPVKRFSTVVPANAGSTLKARAYQTNGLSAPRNLAAGGPGAIGKRIEIHRIYNDSTPTGRVTGILWGA